MNALVQYTLLTKADAFNTILAVFMNIFFIFALGALWMRTYQIRSELPKNDRRVHSLDKAEAVVQLPLTSEKEN